MRTALPALDAETDVEEASDNPAAQSDNQTSEALAALNPADMAAADLPFSMTASLATVRRGYSVVARNLDVADPGIDAPDQRSGGRLDQGGFLGRPSGWSR